MADDSETTIPLLEVRAVPDSYGLTDSTATRGEGTSKVSSLAGGTTAIEDVPCPPSSTDGSAARDKEKTKRCMFVSFAILVVTMYAAKGVLLVAKYTHPVLQENDTIPVEGDDSPELHSTGTSYYFTVVVYLIISVLRCIEYIPLILGLYHFYTARSKWDHNCHGSEGLCHHIYPQCSLISFLLATELVLALSIAPVGVAVEYTHEKDHYSDIWAWVFYSYCFVNIFRYEWSFIVRVGMVLITLRVRQIWESVPSTATKQTKTLNPNPRTGPENPNLVMVNQTAPTLPLSQIVCIEPDTSTSTTMQMEQKESTSASLTSISQCGTEKPTAETPDSTSYMEPKPSTTPSPRVVTIQQTAVALDPNQNTEPTHETAVAQHARLTKEYMKAGQKVQILANIFQAWFLLPWIIFSLESYLEVGNILSPWKGNKEKMLPVVYLILFNINQSIFLLIPYICGQKMNHYHHHCHVRIQEMQLSPTKSDDDLAEARKILIQKEDDYDFVPYLWGLGFKVRMNSMIYIIFLLLGFFFTACGALV